MMGRDLQCRLSLFKPGLLRSAPVECIFDVANRIMVRDYRVWSFSVATIQNTCQTVQQVIEGRNRREGSVKETCRPDDYYRCSGVRRHLTWGAEILSIMKFIIGVYCNLEHTKKCFLLSFSDSELITNEF